jgi:very-short-patch-repair endonuclease
VTVVEALTELGGVATRSLLIRATSRAEVDRAVAEGGVTVLARGRYALEGADAAVAAAHRLSGAVTHLSAAMRHGWQVRLPPERPQVAVPHNRKLVAGAAAGVDLHRARLGADDVSDGVTSQERTLLDCLRSDHLGDALCVADSALRDGFPAPRMAALARDARGPGSRQVRRVAALADSRAESALESALRAIAIEVPVLEVVPQTSLREGSRFLGRPDLVDERLAIILEADSFAWHGDRSALHRDARRYNQFAARGWLVLRFSWEDVILNPRLVAEVLTLAVAERTNRGLCPTCAA